MANGHGGKRVGAGGKPEGYRPPQERLDLEVEKTRHEAIKADLAELTLRRERGELVVRAAGQQANATALARLTQALRSAPDELERKLGLSPEVISALGDAIDSALNQCADEFEAAYQSSKREQEALEDQVEHQ
jgi:phage terminase Nu1 subunit (DNA packaging protein)